MSTLQTNVPLINVPLITADGRLNQIWFAFFVQLWRRTGGATGGDGQLTIADVLSYEVTTSPILPDFAGASMGFEMAFAPSLAPDPLAVEAIAAPVAAFTDPLSIETTLASVPSAADPLAVESAFARVSDAPALLEMSLAQMSDSMGAQAAKSITLGASPATYTATYRQALHITGGTVSAISLARSGTSLTLAATTNLIELSAGDQVTVTYTALPTTTVLGR
jgi:hypothetical protein